MHVPCAEINNRGEVPGDETQLSTSGANTRGVAHRAKAVEGRELQVGLSSAQSFTQPLTIFQDIWKEDKVCYCAGASAPKSKGLYIIK